MPLEPADLRNVGFSSASLFRRGYSRDEVDAFLELAEAAIAGALEERKAPAITPADVRAVAFSNPPFGQRGYDCEEVDLFLETLAKELQTLADRASEGR